MKNSERIEGNANSTKFNLTVFISEDAPLNKTITLEDGRLKKAANGNLAQGHVQVAECTGLSEFNNLLLDAEPHVAFALGRPHHNGQWLGEAKITLKDKIDQFDLGRAIARSKDYFRFQQNEPSLFLFDVDSFEGTGEELWQRLCEVDPQLENVGHLIVPSSSSGILAAETLEPMAKGSGFHIYCLAENGEDLPRYGQVFAKRAWLAGHGHIEVSSAGSFLVRQIVDVSVYSPERLIFEAAPEVGEGLIQQRPENHLVPGGLLDTALLQDLKPEETVRYLLLVDEGKEEANPIAHDRREKWVVARGEQIAEQTGCDLTVARYEARMLLDAETLSGKYLLHFDQFGPVSVDDVLLEPEKYDGQTMADPVEPDYNGGRNVAKFYWNNGRPRVHSFAHGGKTYPFDPAATTKTILEKALSDLKLDDSAHWEPEVISAAYSLSRNDMAAYQRFRSQLKTQSKNANITKWEREVFSGEDVGGNDEARELVNVVNVISETFHDKKGIGYITIDMNTHKETWNLDSKGFHEWLEYYAYHQLESVPTETTLNAVISVLQGQARHEGPEVEVYIRCAPYADGYLIDLTNERWQVVKVGPEGWKVLDESPVKFIRSQTAAPFPTPSSGDIMDFWSHVNVPEEHRTLVLTWMLDALRPDSVFTVLELTGEHGSAKSSTHTRIRQLTDPNSVPLRTAPKDVQDIYVSAGQNWQASFENMSYLSDGMQDALCTLATGGGFATRRLYTNAEESVIDVKRPCIINGISAVATRPDLIDRIIHVDLPPIDSYIPKKDLDERFERDLPGLFAGLLDVFSETLRQLPHVRVRDLPRMGDYTLLGQALHVALGDKRLFVNVYNQNKSESLRASLDGSPVALAVLDFAQEHSQGWTGTTQELKKILDARPHDFDGWPKSPKGLGSALRRMGGALRETGVHITHERTRNGFELTITYVFPTETSPDYVHNVHMFTDAMKY